MSGEQRPILGPLSSEVMAIVWEHDAPITVREVVDRLNHERASPLAYTTVMTVMARLAEKGTLRRHADGRSYLYEAAASDPAGLAVRELLRDFGSSAVASFVDQARADPKLLRRLRRLLEEEP